MNKILLLPVISILLFCAPVFADYAKGLDAAQKGDFVNALKEWKPLAEQGDASAQYNLGVMYDNGEGVIQDYTRAHMWWNIAASQGHEEAMENRDKVAKEMTSLQIAEAQKLARECVAKNYKGC
jgi:TPR repeat protein